MTISTEGLPKRMVSHKVLCYKTFVCFKLLVIPSMIKFQKHKEYLSYRVNILGGDLEEI